MNGGSQRSVKRPAGALDYWDTQHGSAAEAALPLPGYWDCLPHQLPSWPQQACTTHWTAAVVTPPSRLHLAPVTIHATQVSASIHIALDSSYWDSVLAPKKNICPMKICIQNIQTSSWINICLGTASAFSQESASPLSCRLGHEAWTARDVIVCQPDLF